MELKSSTIFWDTPMLWINGIVLLHFLCNDPLCIFMRGDCISEDGIAASCRCSDSCQHMFPRHPIWGAQSLLVAVHAISNILSYNRCSKLFHFQKTMDALYLNLKWLIIHYLFYFLCHQFYFPIIFHYLASLQYFKGNFVDFISNNKIFWLAPAH